MDIAVTDRAGQQLGNYRLIRLLGRGGFAEVYLGEHRHLKTQVAVKILHTSLEDDDVAGFLLEAQTVAHLKHSHIVRVFDFDVENHTPFLVMDYLPNGNVRRSYPKGTPLPLETIVSYVKQVASALQYAHDQKLIHRDIKPENMLLDRDNTIVLSDFGIALMAQSSRYQNTQEIAGTASYMAPEQLQGKPRPASDQYALGITVYEWLCGDRPFKGTFTELYSQHLFVPPPPLREKMPTISSEVELVILTALEKDPHKRFAGVLIFATALERACQQTSTRPNILSSQTPIPSQRLPPTHTVNVVQPGQTPQLKSVVTSLSQQPESTLVVTPSTTPTVLPRSIEDSTSFGESQRFSYHISRRAVVIGLAGLAGASGSLVWLALSRRSHLISPITTPTRNPNLPSLGATLFIYRGHIGQVLSVAWSPDSKRIASGSDDHTVQIWDATTGGHVYIYHGHSNTVTAVVWSPDSRRIASVGDDSSLQVWDAITGGNVFANTDNGFTETALAWSTDGKYIASGDSAIAPNGNGGEINKVRVWNATTGNLVFTYRGHPAAVSAVAWSPDSKRIASGSDDHTVQIWDATTGGNTFKFLGHSDMVTAVEWSPDGKRIASCGFDMTVQICNGVNGGDVFTYHGHSDVVYTIAWSPDGKRIASGGVDRTVQVWDSTTGKILYIYRGHSNIVNSVEWSPDGQRIASGSSDKTVHVWQAV